jgi:hypothetical protein
MPTKQRFASKSEVNREPEPFRHKAPFKNESSFSVSSGFSGAFFLTLVSSRYRCALTTPQGFQNEFTRTQATYSPISANDADAKLQRTHDTLLAIQAQPFH